MAELEQRFIDLEEQLAFQEDTTRKLDEAMTSQQRQLLEFQRQLQLLAEQIRKLEAAMPEGTRDEKPPHY